MAKRTTPAKTPAKSVEKTNKTQFAAAPEVAATTSPVRKTVTPRKTAAPKVATSASLTPSPITHDRIAERAYYISQSGYGGTEDENWHQAERELREGR